MGNQTADAKIEKVWQIRYSDTEKVNIESKWLYDIATKDKYLKGQMYALLNNAATSFLLSNDVLLPELIQCAGFFENTPNEKGLTISYNYLGNVYENIGAYNEAINYCYKSVKAAKEINYTEGIGDSYNTSGMG